MADVPRRALLTELFGELDLRRRAPLRLLRLTAAGVLQVNMVGLSCGETYVQASGDASQTFVLDMRRHDRRVRGHFPFGAARRDPALADGGHVTGRPLHVLQHDAPPGGHHVNGVSAGCAPRSHATLVTGSDDSYVRIWDVSLGSSDVEVARLQGHSSAVSCVAFSLDDDVIASGGDEGKVVLYTRQTGGAALLERGLYSVGKEQDHRLLTEYGGADA